MITKVGKLNMERNEELISKMTYIHFGVFEKTVRTLYLRKSKNLFYFEDLLVTGEFNHDVCSNPAVLKFYTQ